MSKRPSRLLAWAYNAAGGAVVEPPGGLSAAGWVKNTRPPAPYMNFLFNTVAGWLNFLRGPNLANWSRQSPITAFSDTTHIPLKMVAVDTQTADGATAAWRYVVVGSGTGGDPARQLWCSRRGDAWVRRTNLPVGADGTMGGVHFNANRSRWLCWTTGGSGDGQVFYTPAGNSGAVGDDGVDWLAATVPGSTPDIVCVAGCNGSRVVALTINGILSSADGGVTFAAATLVDAFTGVGLDLAWTGAYFLALSSLNLFRSTNGASDTWARSTLPEVSTRHRIATDGAGTVCVYSVDESTVQDILLSTDHGATWSVIAGTAGMVHLKRLVYGDGVWIATSSDSPYLWQSNDLVKWVRLAPPVLESGSLVPLDVVFADARWLCVGNGFTLLTSRASDPMPGSFVPNGDPPVLADAGYLRGRKVATTAPTDGQALAWSVADEQWEPTTISGGGGGTPRSGTLAARGAAATYAGTLYRVTSGAGTGDLYASDGSAWSLLPGDRGTSPDQLDDLCWRLDETSGVYASTGLSSIDLTVTGSPRNRAAGSYSGRTCVDLGASVAVLASPNAVAGVGLGISNAPTALTFSAWIYVRAHGSPLSTVVVAEYDHDHTTAPYVCGLSVRSNGIQMHVIKAAAYQAVSTACTVATDRWLHVGACYSGGNVSFYLDGELTSTETTTGGSALDLGTTSRWVIGSQSGAVEPLNGRIAETRIYAGTRAATWFREVYARGIGAFLGTP